MHINLNNIFLYLFSFYHFVFGKYLKIVNGVVEWLECWDCDQHCCSSIPTCAILLYFWKRHFMALIIKVYFNSLNIYKYDAGYLILFEKIKITFLRIIA